MDPGNSGKSSKLKLEISGLGKSWREALALENSGEVQSFSADLLVSLIQSAVDYMLISLQVFVKNTGCRLHCSAPYCRKTGLWSQMLDLLRVWIGTDLLFMSGFWRKNDPQCDRNITFCELDRSV